MMSHCLQTCVITYSLAITKAIGSAISILIGCCFMRRIQKYASSLYTAQEHIPTYSVKVKSDS